MIQTVFVNIRKIKVHVGTSLELAMEKNTLKQVLEPLTFLLRSGRKAGDSYPLDWSREAEELE